jgi:hypothetical protein
VATKNTIEHDEDGSLEIRAKEKLVEIIVGESMITNYLTYSEEVVEIEVLMNLPIDNLVMIEKKYKKCKIA